MNDFHEDETDTTEDEFDVMMSESKTVNVAMTGLSWVTGHCAHGGSCEYVHTGYAWTCAHRYVTA